MQTLSDKIIAVSGVAANPQWHNRPGWGGTDD